MSDWGLPNKHLITEVDENTICQFIGIYDKNKKEKPKGEKSFGLFLFIQFPIRKINVLRIEERDVLFSNRISYVL